VHPDKPAKVAEQSIGADPVDQSFFALAMAG
jgi:hypothetical protein